VHILCTTAFIEASHNGNFNNRASEIAKIIANNALAVESSFGIADIQKVQAKLIKDPQRLAIGSSGRAVRTEMMSN
jgi:hypothetical protein